MKIQKLAIAAVLFTIVAALALGAEEAKEVTLAGEVVDLHCYATKHGGEGKGAEHAGCANSCIRRGVSAGFLANDGTLYVLFDAEMTSPKERIAGLAGQPVTATGVILERDGVKAFRLMKIEAAEAD